MDNLYQFKYSSSGWILGMFISLVVGSLATRLAHKLNWHFLQRNAEREKWDVPWNEISPNEIQPIITGILERLLFTILFAFNFSGTSTAMVAWISLKMAIGWKRFTGIDKWKRSLAFYAVINNLISFLFAISAALIINGLIPIPYEQVEEVMLASLITFYLFWPTPVLLK